MIASVSLVILSTGGGAGGGTFFFLLPSLFQAMLAVLDRPLRSNFVTVSTAINRVAKLAAERTPSGMNDEKERKHLGVLLKVHA